MRMMLGVAAVAAAGAFFVACADDKPAATVAVKLDSFTVSSDKAEVMAGNVTFKATNAHASEVHELAVLRVRPDGSFENLGEVEDLGPGKGGEVTIALTPGDYLLACLIAEGEAGSKVDHFAYGMRRAFTVK
ncbi:MAG: hypothetical protein C0506_14495 [Anaerolinea sp.]|nr:hypothetical protein [Anaerolinea sp.]